MRAASPFLSSPSGKLEVVEAEAATQLRRAMILTVATCRTLIDRLDPDDLDQLGLITRLDEMCDLIEGDLGRLTGRA